MSKKSLLIAAVAILVIAIIGITYLLFTEKKANRELVQEFQLDKEDLENEYSRFVQEYDELKIKISNDSLGVIVRTGTIKDPTSIRRTSYCEEFECNRDSSFKERIGYLT